MYQTGCTNVSDRVSQCIRQVSQCIRQAVPMYQTGCANVLDRVSQCIRQVIPKYQTGCPYVLDRVSQCIPIRAGHVPTFLKSFRSVLERGPSPKSFRSRSSFFIVPFSFRSVPFRSVLSRRTVFPFRSVLGVLS